MPNRNQEHAFTLVEVMVGLALASMLLIIITAVFHQAGTVVSQAQRRAELLAEARGIMNLLRNDIKAACAIPNRAQLDPRPR